MVNPALNVIAHPNSDFFLPSKFYEELRLGVVVVVGAALLVTGSVDAEQTTENSSMPC